MADIKASGSIKDGRVTVKAELDSAKVKLSWDIEGDIDENNQGDINILLSSLPEVTRRVVTAIMEKVEADRE